MKDLVTRVTVDLRLASACGVRVGLRGRCRRRARMCRPRSAAGRRRWHPAVLRSQRADCVLRPVRRCRALCCTSIGIAAVPAAALAVLVDAADSGRVVEIVATTTETLVPGRDSFELRIDSVGGERTFRSRRERSVSRRANRIGIGSTIVLSATVTRQPTRARTSRYLIFPVASPELSIAAPPWYLEWANAWRESFLAATARFPATEETCSQGSRSATRVP